MLETSPGCPSCDGLTADEEILYTAVRTPGAMGGADVLLATTEQAQRLYGAVQQLEQEWHETWHFRGVEEARARPGGHTFQAPAASAAPAGDSVARLVRAKAMLDQELIANDEYRTVKAKILAAV